MQALFDLVQRAGMAPLIEPATLKRAHLYHYQLSTIAYDFSKPALLWMMEALEKEWFMEVELERVAELAASCGNVDMLELVLSDVCCDIEELIVLAATHGQLDVICYLQDNPLTQGDVHAYEEQALRVAAQQGHLHVVEHIAADLTAEEIEIENNAAVLNAVTNGHEQVVRYLVMEKGVRLGSDGFQALSTVCMKLCWPVLDIYLEMYGRPVILFQVAEWGYTEAIKYICNQGEMEQGILHMAARIAAGHNQFEVIEFLLSDITVLNTVVLEAILSSGGEAEALLQFWCSSGGDVEFAQLLFQAAASVGEQGLLMQLILRFTAAAFDAHEALWQVCTGCKSVDCAEFLCEHFTIDPLLILIRAGHDLFAFVFAADLFPATMEKHAEGLLQGVTGRVRAYMEVKLSYREW